MLSVNCLYLRQKHDRIAFALRLNRIYLGDRNATVSMRTQDSIATLLCFVSNLKFDVPSFSNWLCSRRSSRLYYWQASPLHRCKTSLWVTGLKYCRTVQLCKLELASTCAPCHTSDGNRGLAIALDVLIFNWFYKTCSKQLRNKLKES